MSIPLPPLPRLFASDKLQQATEVAILTARDLEIARVVLAAAAQAAELWHANGIEVEIARDIRALEFHHE